ncbi:hypothetical protein D9757_002054 [Collybiopsis confluens]|uniref:Uncharacterized protein n=1 Tax=Collybiopsis confluens TaxID=2823264 RepID=A0A8H5HY12_9AGAR|nr:hypothetical protein D9757_002054 [Collybiopsis confluens]
MSRLKEVSCIAGIKLHPKPRLSGHETVVATKLDADLKPLPAKQISVSVRCYEFRLGRIGGVVSSRLVVDQTQVLWSRPEFCDLGEAEYSFKIVIPPRVGGFSTVAFVEYKCVWRVEATIHHTHISGIGSKLVKHIDLPLLRYDAPSLPAVGTISTRIITKPKAPTLRYQVSVPQTPIGPADLLPICIHVFPEDSNVIIRSATVVVERRIQFNEIQHSPSLTSPPISIPKSPSVSSLMSYSPSQSLSSPTASTVSLATAETITRPLLPPPSKNRSMSDSSESLNTLSVTPPTTTKSIVLPITGSESSGPFARLEAEGVSTKTLTIQWPSAKPSSRWGIGETVVGSELVSVRFFAKVKIIITTPHSTDSYELEEEEILVTGTTSDERKLAEAKIHSSSERSKSKSPRRTRRKRDSTPEHGECEEPNPVAPPSSEPKSPRHTKPPPVPRIPRRPHTSAGPGDSNHRTGFSRRLSSTKLASSSSSGSVTGSNQHSSPAYPIPSTLIAPTHPHSSASSASSLRKRSLDVNLKRPATVSHSGTTQVTPRNVFGHVFSPTSLYSQSIPPSTSTPHPPSSYTAPMISSTTSMSSSSSSSTGSANTFSSAFSSASSVVTSPVASENEDSLVREWEAELARIEAKSRRGSDLLGFGWVRGLRGGLRSSDGGNVVNGGGNKRKRAMTTTSLPKSSPRDVLLQT